MKVCRFFKWGPCLDDVDILASGTRNTPVGPYWDVITAPSFTDPTKAIRLGVLPESFRIAERTGTAVAQYTYIVRLGLAEAVHLFRGLKRRMKYGDDMDADEKVLVYMWRPPADFEWIGGRNSRAFPAKHLAPPGRVFVVLVRPFSEPDQFGVSGTVLKWNWVYGNVTNFDWTVPYKDKLWSKT